MYRKKDVTGGNMCEKTKKEMDHIRDRDLHGGDHYDLVILFSDFKGKSKCR